MNSLEKAGRISNKFKKPFYKKKSWLMDYRPDPDKIDRGINPFRDKWLDKNYPGIRDNEYDAPPKK